MNIQTGEFYEINNTSLSGVPFVEGSAKIIKAGEGHSQYLVEFENGDRVERFVDPDNKVNGFHGSLLP